MAVALRGASSSFHDKDAIARCADKHISILEQQDMGDVCGDGFSILVRQFYVVELGAVVDEKTSVGTQEDVAILILCDTVDVIGVEMMTPIVHFLEDLEVITIIDIEAIASGNPDETIRVLVNLCGKVAGQLIVSIE